MKRAKVFSPRREVITLDGIHDTDTVGALRTRIRQMLKSATSNDVLLLRGQVLKDEDTAGMRLENEEEVLFYTEISPPLTAAAMQSSPLGGLFGSPFGGGQGAQGGAQPAPHRPITAADLAGMFGARAQSGGNAPQQAAATRRSASGGTAGRTEERRLPPVPTQLLRELSEMGFSETRAIAALRQSNNDLMDAVTWLSDNADESDEFFANAANKPPAPPPSAPAPSAAVRSVVPPRGNVEPSPEVKQYAEIFDPVFRAIALVANGDPRPNRSFLENTRLPAMEKDGWRNLKTTVQRIWAGERNEATLTAILDVNTSFFVRRILELIRSPSSTGEVDFYVRFALPKDPKFEHNVMGPLKPWVRRIAAVARRQTAQALSEMLAEPTAADTREEEVVNNFVADLDAKGWQLRGPLEMLCAGVRSEDDILECVTPLGNGLPDDNSIRLVRAIMDEIEKPS